MRQSMSRAPTDPPKPCLLSLSLSLALSLSLSLVSLTLALSLFLPLSLYTNLYLPVLSCLVLAYQPFSHDHHSIVLIDFSNELSFSSPSFSPSLSTPILIRVYTSCVTSSSISLTLTLSLSLSLYQSLLLFLFVLVKQMKNQSLPPLYAHPLYPVST